MLGSSLKIMIKKWNEKAVVRELSWAWPEVGKKSTMSKSVFNGFLVWLGKVSKRYRGGGFTKREYRPFLHYF